MRDFAGQRALVDIRMSWFASLFNRGKSANAPVDDLFEKLHSFLNSEEKQNERLPPKLRNMIANAPSVDTLPNAFGEFGKDLNNPIPVNGPVGSVLYLSGLETATGSRVAFQRLGSIASVDAYEIVAFDCRQWDVLYLNMYYPRKSRKLPNGYKPTSPSQFRALVRGTTDYSLHFPKQSFQQTAAFCTKMFGLSIADPSLKAFDTIAVSRPRKHEEFARTILLSGRTEAEDDLELRSIRAFANEKMLEMNQSLIEVAKATDLTLGESPAIECIYLVGFLLTLSMMKANFRSDPTRWADSLVAQLLRNATDAEFAGYRREMPPLPKVVKDYQERYKLYWSHLDAFKQNATDGELTMFGFALAEIFVGSRDFLFATKAAILVRGMAGEFLKRLDEAAGEAQHRPT